uniref:Putative guanine nucleotide binding protein mip1 n=1 Tax=Xenopsylla cheopis TaxID=163159 RepID=A0A6M2DI61_XENCH
MVEAAEENPEKSDTCTDISDWDLPLSFNKNRHTESIKGADSLEPTWRLKERMKTVSVALVLCLNVGVDPPDIIKTQPCARLECWIDPITLSSTKALEMIGANLQKQYERWQPRARYKQSLDPTADEVKKLCSSLRRNAKDERVLFHYNGHGVPKPTTNGEIWVFNRTYTQYIPLSIYDLQAWMGAPSIYVYDCSNAGIIVDSFKTFADQHEREQEMSNQSRGSPTNFVSYKNCIQLAACASNQILPMNPDLPADLFTACLTTPIKVALRWFVMQNTSKLVPRINLELIEKIPGMLTDRRTMLGELNWIFTAITDTIAWNILPRDLFQKLFRQDLLVASLFRNFLLAERILRSYDCTPISYPALPSSACHSMWAAWDLALDLALVQLPDILEHKTQFQHSPFFEEQLTAFQVWLNLGSEKRSPPEQLPIVLQVLLSQVHRVRALELLGKFLDLGPWAVNLALSVGIFPYVLKLLQSSAKELRPMLVFIWAKILAVDGTCQADLVRDNGHKYFLAVLQDPTIQAEHRTLAAFVLACIVNNYPPGQEAALQGSLVSVCLEQLNDSNEILRQWLAICLGRLWQRYEKARWSGVRDLAHEKLYTLLLDPVPEVRAAAVYALGTFISSVKERSEHANNIDHAVAMNLMNIVSQDMSPLVRAELLSAIQWMILLFETHFLAVCLQENIKISPLLNTNDLMISPMRRIASRDRLRVYSPGYHSGYSNDTVDSGSLERMKRVSSSSSISSMGQLSPLPSLPTIGFGSVYMKLWHGLVALSSDPFPQVAVMATNIVDHIRKQEKEWNSSRDISQNMSSSVSLPPSPNTKPNYLGESPPIHLNRPILNRTRKAIPNPISEDLEQEDKDLGVMQPLVTSNYVVWAAKYFIRPVKQNMRISDCESKGFYEREWRFIRNTTLRNEGREEKRRASYTKIESQIWSGRSTKVATVLKFHPYESHLAVAAKDTIGVWDWQSGARLMSFQHNKSIGRGQGGTPCGRITSLEWINPHDLGLLLVGHEEGSVRLWKSHTSHVGHGISRDPTLVSAWQGLTDILPSKTDTNAGVVMCWEQSTQTIVMAGDTRVLRVWDTEHELKLQDIPTGADCSVTTITSRYSHNNILVAGCSDGSLRLFDRRLPTQEARIMTYREHRGWVLTTSLRNNGQILSGSLAGDIKVFDMRRDSSVLSWDVGSGVSAMSFHNTADLFAIGSVNHHISISNLSGHPINSIRMHEGFMGPRIGPVSSLTFHPYRLMLASAAMDCSLCVFSADKPTR